MWNLEHFVIYKHSFIDNFWSIWVVRSVSVNRIKMLSSYLPILFRYTISARINWRPSHQITHEMNNRLTCTANEVLLHFSCVSRYQTKSSWFKAIICMFSNEISLLQILEYVFFSQSSLYFLINQRFYVYYNVSHQT